MFSPMDPEEEITVGFNFSNVTKNVSSPTIEVSIISGTDDNPNPNHILDETPQIYQNNIVLQRIKGVIEGVNYQLRCKVIAENGDVIIHTDSLPVRNAPYIG